MTDDLLLYLHGGPWDGWRVPLEPGWSFPDVFMHVMLPPSGRYVRVEDSYDYEWIEQWTPVPSTAGEES